MANITKHLTSISFDSRSGPSPGRRLLALVLVVMLALGSTFPGFALAGESDSEGEGTAPPVEVPVAPDFDPGGEEEGLEETPATGGDEETGAVEVESEADLEVPPVDEVTGAATETPSEAAAPPQPVESPEPTAAAAPEPVQQQAPEAKTSEPVANQSIAAPKQKPDDRQAASSGQPSSGESAPAPASEPSEEEAPSAPPPQPAAPPPSDHGRHIAGKTYIVKSGDCLWHIAARVLPVDADTEAIESKIEWLYERNESRIGTGDPDLIYPGTELIVR